MVELSLPSLYYGDDSVARRLRAAADAGRWDAVGASVMPRAGAARRCGGSGDTSKLDMSFFVHGPRWRGAAREQRRGCEMSNDSRG
jgi:hypothetical protein